MTNEELLHKLFMDEIVSNDVDYDSNYKIKWNDVNQVENSIYIDDITHYNDIYAWYETNDIGKDKVKIKLSETITVEWRPPINFMAISFGGCKFIKIHKDILIVCYANKHNDDLVFINLKSLEVENIYIEGYRKKINLINNELFIREEYSQSNFHDYKITFLEDKYILEKILK